MRKRRLLASLFITMVMIFSMAVTGFADIDNTKNSINPPLYVADNISSVLTDQEISFLQESQITPFYSGFLVNTNHSRLSGSQLVISSYYFIDSFFMPAVPEVFGYYDVEVRYSSNGPWIRAAGGTNWSFRLFNINYFGKKTPEFFAQIANLPSFNNEYRITLRHGYYEIDGMMYTMPSQSWIHRA